MSGLTTNPGAKAFAPHQQKTHECRANNACVNGGFCAAKRRKSRPVEGRRPGTYLTHWLEAGHPMVAGHPLNTHACSKEVPHILSVQHRYKPPNYPTISKLAENGPTTFSIWLTPINKPNLATKFGAEFDGLGNDATSEITTELTAKAFAPNHHKMTEALAYNASHHR